MNGRSGRLSTGVVFRKGDDPSFVVVGQVLVWFGQRRSGFLLGSENQTQIAKLVREVIPLLHMPVDILQNVFRQEGSEQLVMIFGNVVRVCEQIVHDLAFVVWDYLQSGESIQIVIDA